ncbi:unnamed protein product [Adineta ricciae]|uniref:Uncharacterized protein n=1 Tax=Adineta ricciae TaxID=249248 RepID=A0A815NLL8_ADIRI|nr:unnamed protein product [Adineta ricciae]
MLQNSLMRRPTGIIGIDEKLAYDGYTLFTPLNDSGYVYLIDMYGNELHRWALNVHRGLSARLLPNGNLALNGEYPDFDRLPFSQHGLMSSSLMVEVDKNGVVLRENNDNLGHSDAYYYDDGRILYTTMLPLDQQRCKEIVGGVHREREGKETIYSDIIKEIDKQGYLLWEWKADDHLSYQAYPIQTIFDRYHWPWISSVYPMSDGKSVLASLRVVSSVIIISKLSGDVIWSIGSELLAQQSYATELLNQNILIFDNGNYRQGQPHRYSRVIEVNRETKQIVWQYVDNMPESFFSSCMGAAQRLPNGNTLITESIFGRLFEVTVDGTVCWEYINPYFNQLRDPLTKKLLLSRNNVLCRAYRYSAKEIPWLNRRVEESKLPREISLDPVCWTGTGKLAHSMLTYCLNFLQTIRDRPAWQPIPLGIQNKILDERLPETPQEMENICESIKSLVFPYSNGNIHPRFWGWVGGNACTVGGILAELFTSTLNVSVAGRLNSGLLLEKCVLEWVRQIFDFPTACSSLLVSGSSMATIIALCTARNNALKDNGERSVRRHGITEAMKTNPIVAYCSSETHFCVTRAFELLGLGSDSLRLIPCDDQYRINIDLLKKKINEDRQAAFTPFCLIGNAGTTNTGAIDNLLELAALAKAENLWFHVDGALGGAIILSSSLKSLVNGIQFADSIAFDFHKWLQVPFTAGCVLVRNGQLQLKTFSPSLGAHSNSKYVGLNKSKRGSCDRTWISDYGLEVSRPNRALKIWFLLKEHGLRKLGKIIEQNCKQAQYLLELLEKHHPLIQVFKPVTLLNIVCFRLEPPELIPDATSIDLFNNEIVADLEEDGTAVVSLTTLKDICYIRVCLISHRSTRNDLQVFVEALIRVCEKRRQLHTSRTDIMDN